MTTDAVGGVWSYALDLARGLIGEGVSVLLAVLGPAAGARQRAAAAAISGLRLAETGLPLEWTAEDAATVLAAGRRLAALAQAEGAGLVHLNSPALAAGGSFTMPVVAACHSCVASWWEAVRGGPLPADLAWRSALVAEGYHAADRLLAPSAAFAATTARLYGLARPPAVVHNGRARLAAARPPECLPERFVFAAGRLWDEGKNLGLLDGIAARLPLPVVTAGPLAGPLGGAVALPDLHNLGPLDSGQMAACFRAASLFAAPARYEPFGLTVLEAAQAGCPLVLADIASFRELWGGVAEFADPEDGAAFAAAIGRLLGDAALLRERGAAAAARARRYTPEAMTRATRELYDAVLAPQPCREARA